MTEFQQNKVNGMKQLTARTSIKFKLSIKKLRELTRSFSHYIFTSIFAKLSKNNAQSQIIINSA